MNTREFLGTKLGGLLRGLKTATVVATTKNEIAGMDYIKEGSVDCPPGLSMQVFIGNETIPSQKIDLIYEHAIGDTEPYTIERMLAVGVGDDIISQFKDIKTFQKIGTLEKQSSDDGVFLVAYVGFHGLFACIESIQAIKADNPDLRIITVACDCNAMAKRHLVEPLIESGQIEALLIDPECGGLMRMRHVLDGFREKWPLRNET